MADFLGEEVVANSVRYKKVADSTPKKYPKITTSFGRINRGTLTVEQRPVCYAAPS
jgi:hypothetical protein